MAVAFYAEVRRLVEESASGVVADQAMNQACSKAEWNEKEVEGERKKGRKITSKVVHKLIDVPAETFVTLKNLLTLKPGKGAKATTAAKVRRHARHAWPPLRPTIRHPHPHTLLSVPAPATRRTTRGSRTRRRCWRISTTITRSGPGPKADVAVC